MPTPNAIYDTTSDAESMLIRLLQNKPASDRLKDAVAASNRVARQCKEAIRRNNPDCTEEDVKLLFIALNYGQEIADNVRAYVSKQR
jgi:RNase P protein component